MCDTYESVALDTVMVQSLGCIMSSNFSQEENAWHSPCILLDYSYVLGQHQMHKILHYKFWQKWPSHCCMPFRTSQVAVLHHSNKNTDSCSYHHLHIWSQWRIFNEKHAVFSLGLFVQTDRTLPHSATTFTWSLKSPSGQIISCSTVESLRFVRIMM